MIGQNGEGATEMAENVSPRIASEERQYLCLTVIKEAFLEARQLPF